MKLSVVVPCYNEEQNIEPLARRLIDVCDACCDELEIIFVDDGSADKTVSAVRRLQSSDPRIRLLELSRNFGHEIATSAGLDHVTGNAIVIIDADLQDPPEIIPQMIERWKDGVDVVYAQRRTRSGESRMKRATAGLYYRVLDRLSEVTIPRDTGDFRLMDRGVVEAMNRCRENPRFVRGLCAWVGFRQEAIQFDRDPRHAGETKYNYRKLVALALESVTSFSVVPLRLVIYLGMVVTALSAVLLLAIIAEKLFMQSNAPRGYAFLAVMMLFIGGVQLVFLGMIGQYVGAIFRNVQGRPLYLLREQTNRDGSPTAIVEPKSTVAKEPTHA